MQLIEVITLFDCTPTGTKSYRKLNGTVTNAVGQEISTIDEWNYSRNQQRNWETILQCISLKTQPLDIIEPVCAKMEEGKIWTFTFGVEATGIFDNGNDLLGLLKDDLHGVPMITGLDETYKEGFLMPYLIPRGESANIYLKLFQEDSST